jgi:hypothetical protein
MCLSFSRVHEVYGLYGGTKVNVVSFSPGAASGAVIGQASALPPRSLSRLLGAGRLALAAPPRLPLTDERGEKGIRLSLVHPSLHTKSD